MASWCGKAVDPADDADRFESLGTSEGSCLNSMPSSQQHAVAHLSSKLPQRRAAREILQSSMLSHYENDMKNMKTLTPQGRQGLVPRGGFLQKRCQRDSGHSPANKNHKEWGQNQSTLRSKRFCTMPLVLRFCPQPPEAAHSGGQRTRLPQKQYDIVHSPWLSKHLWNKGGSTIPLCLLWTCAILASGSFCCVFSFFASFEWMPLFRLGELKWCSKGKAKRCSQDWRGKSTFLFTSRSKADVQE